MLEQFTALLPLRFRPYAKFVVSLIGVVLTVLSVVAVDNKAVVVAVAIATALGVYGVPNEDADGDGIPDSLESE